MITEDSEDSQYSKKLLPKLQLRNTVEVGFKIMGDLFLAKKALLYNMDARFQKLDVQSAAKAFSKFCVYKAPILQQSPKPLNTERISL